MTGEWNSTTLGEVADMVSGGTPSKGRPDYWSGSIPWVSAKDMKRFRLDNTEDHVSDYGAANGTRLVPGGSVLLLVRGMTLLKDLPICVIDRPMTFNQDVKALKPRQSVRSDYLPYLILGNKPRLLSLVDLAGHGTGRLNSDEVKSLNVVLPPLSEQRTIAHILGTLDDKIELNRRMSETLEEIVQALFTSWFVDFDPVQAKSEDRVASLPKPLADLFPTCVAHSEVGKIPEGWTLGEFGQVADHLRGTVTPHHEPDAEFLHFSLPAYDDGQQPRLETGDKIKSNKWRVSSGAVLLSKLNPEIERVWMVDFGEDERAVCSTEFLVLSPIPPVGRCYLYCLCKSARFRSVLEGLVTGTSKSHQRAQVGAILRIVVVMPSVAVLEAFERAVTPMLDRVLTCRRESVTLTTLRDTLLPKLISGEVRVPDAERIVSEVV